MEKIFCLSIIREELQRKEIDPVIISEIINSLVIRFNEEEFSSFHEAEVLDRILAAFDKGGSSALPGIIPEKSQARLDEILNHIQTLQTALSDFTSGDLERSYPISGYTGGLLKSLQSGLRHLTWQTKMIAAGDLTQHVDFMGDFSQSFNTMVDNLATARGELLNRQEELKSAYELVRENEETFRSIFTGTPDPVFIINKDELVIMDLNPGCEHLFGVTAKELIGLSLLKSGLFANEEGEAVFIDFISLQDGKEAPEIEFISRNGKIWFGSVTCSVVTIRQKSVCIVLVHDIDTLKKAHQAVTLANNKLNILNSITRHDILNRVMVVTYYSQLLAEVITTPDELKRINAVRKSGEDIQSLIEFTRSYQDLGMKEPVWQRIDHLFSLRETAGLLEEIKLILPDLTYEIYADRMFEKVVYNLVENSKRHGEKVTIINVSVYLKDQSLLLIYEDNGVGISETEKELIFKRGHGKNTGLGLFLIREILSITGIEIIENGKAGEGVRFEIKVPPGKWREVIISDNQDLS